MKWGPHERGRGRRVIFKENEVGYSLPPQVYLLCESTRQGYGDDDDATAHDDVVITEVKKKVKVRCEIRGTTG